MRMIGTDLPVGEGVAEHDASGLLVLPGGVDVHTHLDWDFGPTRTADTFYTGSQAGAFGGTTTIVDFAAQVKGTSPLEGLADWHERASVAAVDVGAHMIMTEVNDQALIDMKSLIHDEGVTTFKLFTAYPDLLMIDDGSIFKTMRQVGANGGMVQIHAENGHVIDVLVQEALAAGNTSPKWHMLTRPFLMEGEATHRVIRIAELAEAPVYIVHLSASEALDAVTEARDRGLPVHAETCPHYLFLTEEEYDRPGFEAAKFVMTPPLRSAAHQHALWRGLKTDDLQVIATDHCPFCFSENVLGLRLSKELGRDDFSKIPNGAPGLETRMPLVYRRRRAAQRHVAQPLCRTDVDGAGKTLRPVPAQGHDRGGLRRRHRAVRPGRDLDHPRRRASQPGRVLDVRGPRGYRPGEQGVPARRAHRRRQGMARPRGRRPVHQARPGGEAEVGLLPRFEASTLSDPLAFSAASILHFVMLGLVPGIHLAQTQRMVADTWMAGTSPAMTRKGIPYESAGGF